MTPGGMLFFVVFAAIQVGMYLSIRRQWLSPATTAGAGILASIIIAALMALAQGNVLGHALLVGLLMGVLFSGAVLAVSWYFHTRQMPPTAQQ
ncbi:MAG: hypothetical protein ACOYL5_09735 [Phototrophicaceae bacterium]|jgi:hypothetical protein